MRTLFGVEGIAVGCVTTTFCPATTIVVVRSDPVRLLMTAIAAVPVPLPLAPLVMLNQVDVSDAVHVQPLVLVTEMLALPPAAATDTFMGETVNVHGAAFCVTVTVCPATVSVADREVVTVFAVAV
jgi:hypothetical protein